MIHQRISADRVEVKAYDATDPDIVAAIRDALRPVAELTAARAKRPAKQDRHRREHAAYIRSLEADLAMIAGRIGWTPNDLEQVTRAEYNAHARRTGKQILRAPREIVEVVPMTEEQRAADLAVQIARDNIRETERMIGVHHARLVKQQIDLSRKREALRALSPQSAAK